MTTPVLQIRGLTVSAARAPLLLDNVSFDVAPGETVCVVGESGSGKSLTALSVMGLLGGGLRTDGGSILLDGEELLVATPARLRALRASRMSMVFQEPMTALNPVKRVGRQIEEVLRLHTDLDGRRRRQRVLEMLHDVRMPRVQETYDAFPHQLSGGQRQRIVICMALILKPRLLIADEPTTALDVTTQQQILTLMRELQNKQGTAVLFITHDFGVVVEMADRIAVMRKGRVVETGTKDRLLTTPRHDYTRTLISAVPSLTPPRRLPPQNAMTLEVAGVSKVYSTRRPFARSREIVAADDVRFKVRRGEILGLVGESGSGKSTVARCVARLIDPSAGAIRVDGIDIAPMDDRSLRPVRRRVQIVFQDPFRSLNPRMPIGKSLIEGPMNYGMSRREASEKMVGLLEVVGLGPESIHRFPHQFSGGQRQRICIARALALDPALLVADEAVSALDVTVQAQVLRLLDDIRSRLGTAILFITHDLRVAAQICDTIAVMQKGRIVESGSAFDVLSNPRESYTQALIASAPGRHWDFQNFRSAQPPASAVQRKADDEFSVATAIASSTGGKS